MLTVTWNVPTALRPPGQLKLSTRSRPAPDASVDCPRLTRVVWSSSTSPVDRLRTTTRSAQAPLVALSPLFCTRQATLAWSPAARLASGVIARLMTVRSG